MYGHEYAYVMLFDSNMFLFYTYQDIVRIVVSCEIILLCTHFPIHHLLHVHTKKIGDIYKWHETFKLVCRKQTDNAMAKLVR